MVYYPQAIIDAILTLDGDLVTIQTSDYSLIGDYEVMIQADTYYGGITPQSRYPLTITKQCDLAAISISTVQMQFGAILGQGPVGWEIGYSMDMDGCGDVNLIVRDVASADISSYVSVAACSVQNCA